MKEINNLKLSHKIMLPVSLGGILILFGILVGLYVIKAKNTREAGLSTAESIASQIKSMRSFYTKEIAPRAKQAGMELNYDYDQRESVLPLPATFTHALGDQIAKDQPGMQVRLYSRYPYPHRAASETYNDFEKEALDRLEQDPETPIYELVRIEDRLSLRYGIADRMVSEGCVSCHNSHPESPKTDWKLGDVRGVIEVVVPVDEVEASIAKSATTLGLGVIAGFAFLLVMVLWMLRRVVLRPIDALQKATEAVSEGDLSIEMKAASNDEIGDLAHSFNGMVGNIRETSEALQEEKAGVEAKVEEALKESAAQQQYLDQSVVTMLDGMKRFADGDLTVHLEPKRDDNIGHLYQGFNTAVANLRHLCSQVKETVRSTAQAVTQITSNTEALAAGTQEQSAQAGEVAAAVEEMAQTIIQNADNAGQTAAAAASNGQVAQEGGQIVQQTVEKIRQIADVVGQSAETVERLGESSAAIGEIVAVINDIADQTNLLALNAAIEAARAGDQGRGFAVVADEVRKLAERTTGATKQIAEMINTIQAETSQAVQAMNHGREEVADGIKLADDAGEALHRIVSETQGVVDMVDHIAAANQQQSLASEEISRSVEAISTISTESAQGVMDIARSSESLGQLTEKLRGLVAHFEIDRAPRSAARTRSLPARDAARV